MASGVREVKSLKAGIAWLISHSNPPMYLYCAFVAGEMLAAQIASEHNVAFYLNLVKQAREHIKAGDFTQWKNKMVKRLENRL